MRTNLRVNPLVVFTVIVVVLLSACVGGPTISDKSSDEQDWTLEQAIAWAQSDFAQRQGVKTEQVKVISAKAVLWASGARGCPQPGQSYTQALVPGYQIVLTHQRKTAHYHAGEKERPFNCPEIFRVPPSRAGPTVM